MKNHFFKLSTLAILGSALFGMTACSDKDDVAGSENATDDAKQYIAVNIQSVQSMAAGAGAKAATRAANGTYEDGTDDEQKVTSVAFYFFNADGTPFRLSNNDNHNWLGFENGDKINFNPDDNTNNSIEEKSDIVLLLQNNTGASPASMIVVLNPTSFTNGEDSPLFDTNTNTLKDMSLTELRNADLKGTSAKGEDGFVMSNSIYIENGTLRGAVQTAGHIFTSANAAQASPVEVYVERVNAKVRAHLAAASATGAPTTEGTLGTIKATKDITASANGNTTTIVTKGTSYPAYYVGEASDKKIYALVLGWGLADENGQASLEKNLGDENYWTTWNTDLGILPVWSSSEFHRSFWEISVPFNTGTTGGSSNSLVNHSWNSYTTSLSTTATSLYTLPNTHQTLTGYKNCDQNTTQSEFTKFLAKTVLVYNAGTDDAPDWEPAELCYYENNNYFGTSDLRKKVAEEYSKYYTKSTNESGVTYTALTPTDITFTTTTSEAAKNYQVVPCVKDGTYYTKGTDGNYTAVQAATINAEMAANVADVRNAGMTYYYYCIRHLASNPSQIGYLGVVRNHLYDVTVNSMKGFGTPVYDPDKVIIPVVPSNDATYLAAQINVLAWRIVSQTADLEATAGN